MNLPTHELDGQVFLVTASSRGIGAACVRELAQRGARVAMCARNVEELHRTRDEVASQTGRTPYAVQTDLLDPEAVRNLFMRVDADLGPLQGVVVNTPPPSHGGFAHVAGHEDRWIGAYRAVVLCTVRLVEHALRPMLKRGAGSVVAIQSTSVIRPIVELTLSNTVRPGIRSLFEDLSRAYGPQGIRFNVVLPGRITTDRFLAVERASAGSDEALSARLAASAAELPLRRFGEPREVASLVAFLLSDRASYITGTTIPVDGGKLAAGR